MTVISAERNRTKATTSSASRNGHWRVPSGRVAAAQTRRAIRAALQAWGLSAVADDVAPLVVGLVRELESDAIAGGRDHGPMDLRLELREPVGLLLAEIRCTTAGPPGPGDLTPASEDEPGAHVGTIAVTYGRRPDRGGAEGWYAHAFTW